MEQKHKNRPLKADKPPSWAVMRVIFSCKQHLQPQRPTLLLPQKKKKQQQPVVEETSKNYKKNRCSGSLCSNTKVMHRSETASPEVNKKRAALGSNKNDASTRSTKAPLHELNGVVSATNSSLSASSASSNTGSFRGMPFRRLSGCYECRMVVDPILGFARDPSLRSSICSCPECGEIFMKTENLELHQAVRHAGTDYFLD